MAVFGKGRPGRDDRAATHLGASPPTRKLASSWRARPNQRAALALDAGVDLVAGGIGAGKSQAGAFKLLRWALAHPWRKDGRPTAWLVLARDLAHLRQEQFELVLALAEKLACGAHAVVRRVTYGANPKIVLAHGQTILGRSGTEPRRLRGLELDGVWMDEAEYQDEEAFRQAIARQRAAEAVRMIVTTTPRAVRASWLWSVLTGEEYRALRATGQVRLHRWRSRDNPGLDASVMGLVESALSAGAPGEIAQELDGLFVGSAEAPLASAFGDVGRAFVEHATLTPAQARAAVVGVDLGRSPDWTVFAVLGEEGHLLGIDRFNLATVPVGRDDFYSHAEKRLLDLVAAWRAPAVKIDEAMHGMAFVSSIRRALAGTGVRVEGYRTDSSRRKAQAIEGLGVALARGKLLAPARWTAPGRQGEIVVAHLDALRKEIAELVVEERAGFRAFDHPQGGHDDCVVALALAWQGLEARRPNAGGDHSGFGLAFGGVPAHARSSESSGFGARL